MSEGAPEVLSLDEPRRRKESESGAGPATLRRKEGFCDCMNQPVLVDERRRMLECRTCGAAIDPYEFMRHWAGMGWMYADRLHYGKAEYETLLSKIAEAEKVLANLKGRIRRAEKAVP